MGSRNYKDLIVWQKSIELVVVIFEITERFPRSELFGLTKQMRTFSVSIPSNIAEGSKRGTKKDFRKFLYHAFGSGAELETQLEIARRLPFGKTIDFTKATTLLDEVMKMLNTFISSLNIPTN